jgi:hypothetical protein
MEDIKPLGDGQQRLPNLYLLRLFDVEYSELDVLREYSIIGPFKGGIGPDWVTRELSSHKNRILLGDDAQLL